MRTRAFWVALVGVMMPVWASAQEPVSVEAATPPPPELEAFRARVAQTYPAAAAADQPAPVAVAAPVAPPAPVVAPAPVAVPEAMPAVIAEGPRTVALFVRNRSANRALDDHIDVVEDLLAASLAGTGLAVIDKAVVADAFSRFKVTAEDHRQGQAGAEMDGGSVTRVAETVGAQYIVLVNANTADKRTSQFDGKTVNTYQTTWSYRILGADGRSIGGDFVRATYPTSNAGDDLPFFNDLFERAARQVATKVAQSSATWPAPVALAAQKVEFRVKTNLDALVDGLETGVPGGTNKDLLGDLRRLVGGATVELDGLAIGSAPGSFRASPGLHTLRITRAWMSPWEKAVRIEAGSEFSIALELSPEGLQKFATLEALRAAVAVQYAEAAFTKGIKINFDTAAWRDVSLGGGKEQGATTVIQTSVESATAVQAK